MPCLGALHGPVFLRTLLKFCHLDFFLTLAVGSCTLASLHPHHRTRSICALWFSVSLYFLHSFSAWIYWVSIHSWSFNKLFHTATCFNISNTTEPVMKSQAHTKTHKDTHKHRSHYCCCSRLSLGTSSSFTKVITMLVCGVRNITDKDTITPSSYCTPITPLTLALFPLNVFSTSITVIYSCKLASLSWFNKLIKLEWHWNVFYIWICNVYQ